MLAATEGRAGIVVGPDHPGGGVNFHDPLTGNHLQEEGFEINIPDEITKDKRIHIFRGSNSQVINEILKLGGHSLADQVTKVNPGDVIMCVRSAWDTRIRTYVGTVEKILDEISTSNGCNPIRRQVALAKKGGQAAPKGIKQRIKDRQMEDPNSARWKKKKDRIHELSNNIHRLRTNITRDLNSDNERTALIALVISIMDKTGERIGNEYSAFLHGHFGVTVFMRKHIKIIGDKIHLNYIGKSGAKQEKSFSDKRIAKALKKAIKNSNGQLVFETSEGLKIDAPKVNDYLHQFNITAKDIRGYNANRWIIDILKKEEPKREITGDDSKDKKKRKAIFNKAVKETAKRVGHGAATLKKHYMVPELQSEYMAHGDIIDLKNMGYYSEGGRIGDLSISDYFPNKNEMPDAVKKAIATIEEKSANMDKGIYELFTSMPVEVITWENIIPGQDFLRSSKSERLQSIEDIYSIGLPWVIEYEGKFYILDGHHRILEMHDKDIDIKAHVYHVKSENNNTMHNGGKSNNYFNNNTMENQSSKLRSVRVTYDDGTIIPTSMAAHLTDQDIRDYFKVGKSFNIGSGGKDKMAKVKEVEILYVDGGRNDENSSKPTCICFSAFVKKEYPELVDKIENADINGSPELRSQIDEAYQAYNGGKIMHDGGPAFRKGKFVNSKEFYDLRQEFERIYNIQKTDREEKEFYSKDAFYKNGNNNSLFKGFLSGYEIGRLNYMQ